VGFDITIQEDDGPSRLNRKRRPIFGAGPMGQQICPIFRANLPVWRAKDKQVRSRAAGFLRRIGTRLAQGTALAYSACQAD
jgi:hypothetical protein